MKKVLSLLFLLTLLATSVFAQTISERHQKIRAALDKKDFALAIEELQSLRKTDAKIFELNNYDYLLGRTAEKRQDLATAITAFQRVVERKSVLQDYALWHLARLWRSSGNLMLERLFLQQLLLFSPDSLLANAARIRMARSFYESKDYRAVVSSQWSVVRSESKAQSLKAKVEDQSQSSKAKAQNREWLVLLGEAFQRDGQKEKAREVFKTLLDDLPKPDSPDDFALAAVRGLDELDSLKPEDYGKIAPQLPENEHLRRAGVYQFNRAFGEAEMHYRAIDERYPNSQNLAFSLLQRGRIAVLEERFDKAVVHYERLQSQFPNSIQARDALNFEASAYARLGNADEAIARYKLFISKYIDNAAAPPENPERPFLNIIDALRDKGRDTDALSWIEQTRARFKNQLAAAQALFSQMRIHLSQGDWNSALRDLAELENAPDLGGIKVSGGTNRVEIAFLKAFCFEQMGRFNEAISAYLLIPDGRAEYYGGRATERLKDLALNDKARNFIAGKLNFYRAAATQAATANDAERARQAAQNALRLTNNSGIRSEMLDIARRAYTVLPAYKNVPSGEIILLGRQKLLEKPSSKTNQSSHQIMADEFLFLGLDDEAAPELEAVQSLKPKTQSPKTDNLAFTIAVISKRGNLANLAVAYAEPLWSNVPADYLIELAPRESIELLYPAPYSESLLMSAAPRLVDSRFALSIMRQESRYRADVKSLAAARGLMQFIPSTAAQIALALNQTDFAPNDLYDPPTAILFGSQYLSNIFKQFPDQPQAVAASYNGGEANMLRWLLRSKSTDPDRYVPEIQFSQSKDYVYKVLANYRAYQTLYDERLQRK
ncbi:MAG: transglycosylase SLT domain-containing protein [Pyrinomonadaceae bacterium]